MIQTNDIAAALGLTGVVLYVEGGRATITANEPVTDEMQSRVQAWHDAGKVTPPDPWATFLAGHITISGIDLKAAISARDAFTGQIALIREGLDLGQLTPTTEVAIWDAHNVEHRMTVTQCRALLFAYGVAWKTAFDQLAP